jgi:hypothetical protein
MMTCGTKCTCGGSDLVPHDMFCVLEERRVGVLKTDNRWQRSTYILGSDPPQQMEMMTSTQIVEQSTTHQHIGRLLLITNTLFSKSTNDQPTTAIIKNHHYSTPLHNCNNNLPSSLYYSSTVYRLGPNSLFPSLFSFILIRIIARLLSAFVSFRFIVHINNNNNNNNKATRQQGNKATRQQDNKTTRQRQRRLESHQLTLRLALTI